MTANNASDERTVPQLILFVTGDAPRSRRARANLAAALAASNLTECAPLEIDLLKHPQQTVAYSVFATPALVRTGKSGQMSVLYGDLSERDKLMDFLNDLSQEVS